LGAIGTSVELLFDGAIADDDDDDEGFLRLRSRFLFEFLFDVVGRILLFVDGTDKSKDFD